MLRDSDIHLGDVIVSTEVVGYDFGAEHRSEFKRKAAVGDRLSRAPALITNLLNGLKMGKSMVFERVHKRTQADLTT